MATNNNANTFPQPGQKNADGQSSQKRGVKGMFGKGAIAFGAFDVAANMAGGDDIGTAALKTGVSTALWYAAPGAMWAYTTATTVPSLASASHQWYRDRQRWWQQQHLQGVVGGHYQDTQRALTMRQAAVQAIQGSKLNARSALGGEARILSQNWNRGYQ